MQLDADVAKLKLQKASHLSQRYALEDDLIKKFPREIAWVEEHIKGLESDIKTAEEHTVPNEDGFSPMVIMGVTYTSKLLDGIKALGYKQSTMAGISIGIQDIKVPEEKYEKAKNIYIVIAKEYGVSKNTIINIFDTMKEFPRGKLPKVMCVDEFGFSKDVRRKKRYPFVISDPFESSIIDVVEYRTKDVLSEYFEKIPRFERSFVDFYITDMHETYRIIKKKYFPKAVHIIDHFHVAQLFTSKLQSMRIRLMKEYKNEEKLKEYKCLKTNWKYFLMRKYRALEIFTNEDGIVEDIYFTIQDMFRHYEDFNYLYNAREEFFDTMVKMKELEETKKSMDFFVNKFLSSTIIEVQEIGKSLSNRYDEIVNAYAKNEYGFCLTNAVAESNNNYIKELIHISHGFTNFTRFRKRILYINASRNHYKKG